MVYEQRTRLPLDIWRVPGRKGGFSSQAPEKLISSSERDNSPAYSPDGLKIAFAVPPLARTIVGLCDGVRDLGAVHAALQDKRPDLDWPRFQRQFADLYAVLNGINRMVLRLPAS